MTSINKITKNIHAFRIAILFALVTGQSFAFQETVSYALISPEELNTLISSAEKKPVIIDLRSANNFEDEHIPGAINTSRSIFENKLLDYAGMMASKEDVEAMLGELGIEPSSHIVIYDQASGLDATRFWFILKTYGHQKVQLLDGGIDLWYEKVLPVSDEEREITPAKYKFPGKPGIEYYATLDDVKAVMEQANVVILDVRSESEYSDGHIPGAIHLEWVNNLEGSKIFKTQETLQQQFEKAGITADKQIITYCRSGVRAAHTGYVLKELLGYKNVKIYDGSWIEWTHFKEKVEK